MGARSPLSTEIRCVSGIKFLESQMGRRRQIGVSPETSSRKRVSPGSDLGDTSAAAETNRRFGDKSAFRFRLPQILLRDMGRTRSRVLILLVAPMRSASEKLGETFVAPMGKIPCAKSHWAKFHAQNPTGQYSMRKIQLCRYERSPIF